MSHHSGCRGVLTITFVKFWLPQSLVCQYLSTSIFSQSRKRSHPSLFPVALPLYCRWRLPCSSTVIAQVHAVINAATDECAVRPGGPPSAPAQPDFPILEYWGRGCGDGFLRGFGHRWPSYIPIIGYFRERLRNGIQLQLHLALWRARTALTHNNLCSLAQRIRAKRCLNSRKQALCI